MTSTIKDMVGKRGLKGAGGSNLITKDENYNPYKGSNVITKDKYKNPTTGFNKKLRARHAQQQAIKKSMK